MFVEYIKEKTNDKGYPVLTTEEYDYAVKNYSKEDLIESMSTVLMQSRNKDMPFKEIKEKDVTKKLIKLYEKEENFILDDNKDIWTKHDYDFEKGRYFGTIQLGHAYNDISNYFHRHQRYMVGGYSRLSPYEIWNGIGMTDEEWKKKLQGFLSPLFRSVNNYKKIEEEEYMFCFRLSSVCYTATQFKPNVAKIIYKKFSANGKVVDFSMGWGDRLAGFYASKNTKKYLGTDPNLNLLDGYTKQKELYSKTIEDKEVIINSEPSEKYDWNKHKREYDLVFTSPPYFSTELYGKGTESEKEQSWKNYPDSELWIEKFLLKTIKRVDEIVVDGGIFALNIFDVEIKKGQRVEICKKLNSFMTSAMGYKYLGYVGMRMKQRPKTFGNEKDLYMSSYYVEPIWIFQK